MSEPYLPQPHRGRLRRDRQRPRHAGCQVLQPDHARHRRAPRHQQDGRKSEAFCRRTLVTMCENPELIPAGVDLAGALRDMVQLDLMRPRITRLRKLMGRVDDSEMALGSDMMTTALEGYALLKVLGKGSGLDALRRDMASRFSRKSPADKSPADAV